jgi:hypothetical protein
MKKNSLREKLIAFSVGPCSVAEQFESVPTADSVRYIFDAALGYAAVPYSSADRGVGCGGAINLAAVSINCAKIVFLVDFKNGVVPIVADRVHFHFLTGLPAGVGANVVLAWGKYSQPQSRAQDIFEIFIFGIRPFWHGRC